MKENHKDQMCVIFCNADFPDNLLHCVKPYCLVATKGLEADTFDPTQAIVPIVEVDRYKEEAPVPTPNLANNISEDVTPLRSEWYRIDNNHAPENIPAAATNSSECIYQEWGS